MKKKVYKMRCVFNNREHVMYIAASTIIEAKKICSDLFGNSEFERIMDDYNTDRYGTYYVIERRTRL